jgi:predicted alpha/beta-hydrolase family hydrolase
MPRPSELTVPTPVGDARVLIDAVRKASATLVLGHGAGGGAGTRDLAALAAGLPAYGVSVLRVEQPWRVAGKRVAAPPATLDRAWLAVLPAVREEGLVRGSLLVGGRSAGARVACRTALDVGAAGCVCLAFPLHPPGRPERSRVDELLGAGVPTLVLQGERDSFGGPVEFPSSVDVRPVPGADHGMAVTKSAGPSQREVLDLLVTTVAGWAGERLRSPTS